VQFRIALEALVGAYPMRATLEKWEKGVSRLSLPMLSQFRVSRKNLKLEQGIGYLRKTYKQEGWIRLLIGRLKNSARAGSQDCEHTLRQSGVLAEP
jgi:hypothetical protein